MQQLSDLIQNHETEQVEFKEAWQDNTALRSLAAFANTHGGMLIVGVDDKSQVVGWPGNSKELEARTTQIVNSLRTQPSSIRVEEVDGKRVLIIEVKSSQTPVAYRGRYYRRVGNTTQEVPPEELGYFLMQRSGISWDAMPSTFDIGTIDRAQVEHFIQLAQERLPQISNAEETVSILQKLQLLTDGQPTQAAILLFAKTESFPVLMPRVHMGRFKDSITILDNKFVGGSLFQQLDQVMQLFRQYLQVRFEIPTQAGDKTGIEAIQRREIWDFPLDALREAVINALIHRDYMSQATIDIRVYDDEVIISNPGALPEGLTIEDLKQEEHDSLPRNPLIAQIFYYASLVERWGSGTTRMIHACQAQGLPDPEFTTKSHQFKITFRQYLTDKDLLAKGLNSRQVTAIRYLQEHGEITNRLYRELTEVSDESARTDLRDLVQKGLLVTKGEGRSTHYVLLQANAEDSVG